jgi:tetratricopeptide (TPR) repeat protein
VRLVVTLSAALAVATAARVAAQGAQHRWRIGAFQLGDSSAQAGKDCQLSSVMFLWSDSTRSCFVRGDLAGVSVGATLNYYHDRLYRIAAEIDGSEELATVSRAIHSVAGRPSAATSGDSLWVRGADTLRVGKVDRSSSKFFLEIIDTRLSSEYRRSAGNVNRMAEHLASDGRRTAAIVRFREAARLSLANRDTATAIRSLESAGYAALDLHAFARARELFREAYAIDAAAFGGGADSYPLVAEALAFRLQGLKDSATSTYLAAERVLRAEGALRVLDDPVGGLVRAQARQRAESLSMTLQKDAALLCQVGTPPRFVWGARCGADSLKAMTVDSLLRVATQGDSVFVPARNGAYSAASVAWVALTAHASMLLEQGDSTGAERLFVAGLRSYQASPNKLRPPVLGSDGGPGPHIHLGYACDPKQPACEYGSTPADLRARAEAEHFLGDVEGESETLRRLARAYQEVADQEGSAWVRTRSAWTTRILALAAATPSATVVATAPTTAGAGARTLAGALDSLREAAALQARGQRANAIATLERAHVLFRDAGEGGAAIVSAILAERELAALYAGGGRTADALRVLSRVDQYVGRELFPELNARIQWVYVLADIAGVYHRAATPDFYRAQLYYDSASTAALAVLREPLPDEYRTSLADRLADMHGQWALCWLATGGEDPLGRRAQMALGAVEYGRGRAFDLLKASGEPKSPFGEQETPLQGERLGRLITDEGLRRDSAGSTEGPVERTIDYLLARDTLVIWVSQPRATMKVIRVPVDTTRLMVDLAAASLGVIIPGAATRVTAAAAPAAGVGAAPTRGIVGEAVPRARADSAIGRLFPILFPPELRAAIEHVPELSIVVDGRLAAAPFGLLRADSASRPLGVEFALRFAPSDAMRSPEFSDPLIASTEAGLPADSIVCGEREMMGCGLSLDGPPTEPAAARRYYAAISAARRRWLAGSVIVGDPLMPVVRRADTGDTVKFEQLAGARLEAREIGVLTGVTPLLGAAATETAVRARLAKAHVLHFATHGVAYGDPRYARQSMIVFAPGRGADGPLEVRELLADTALTLRAELVVLSACETARGAQSRSEGTIGIQRAFLAKGARSLIVSQWKVSDDATRILMTEFYRGWLDPTLHLDKAQALQRAQAKVRERYLDPFYWAAFQLIGAK